MSPESSEPRCCDHARKIAELRAQLAELHAQVVALTRTAAPASPVRMDDHDGPARPMPSRPGLAAVPGEGGLPRVDHGSAQADKIVLYRALFVGREDVYAYRWENAATGQRGWAPKRRPGSRREDGEFGAAREPNRSHFLPLTDEVIVEHLRDSEQTIGLYVMMPDSTCRMLVCDFDGAGEPRW